MSETSHGTKNIASQNGYLNQNENLQDRFIPFETPQFPSTEQLHNTEIVNEKGKRIPTEVTPQKLKEFTYRRRTTSKSRPAPTSIEETKINKNTDISNPDEDAFVQFEDFSGKFTPFRPPQFPVTEPQLQQLYTDSSITKKNEEFEVYQALPNYTIDANIAPSYDDRHVYRGQKTNFGSFEMSHNFDRSKIANKRHGNRQRKPNAAFPNASTESSILFETSYPTEESINSRFIDDEKVKLQTQVQDQYNSLKNMQSELTSVPRYTSKNKISETLFYPFDPNSKHVVQHFSPAQSFSFTNRSSKTTPSTPTSQEIELSTIPSDVSLDTGNQILKQKQEFSRNDRAKTSTEAYYPSDNSAVYSLDAKPNFSTQIINLHSEYAKFSSTPKPTTVTIHRQSKPAGHSKSIISSPLSTIFDTSGENGQYYHYVMNLGQQPAISERSKPKIYSSGDALYKILNENGFNYQSKAEDRSDAFISSLKSTESTLPILFDAAMANKSLQAVKDSYELVTTSNVINIMPNKAVPEIPSNMTDIAMIKDEKMTVVNTKNNENIHTLNSFTITSNASTEKLIPSKYESSLSNLDSESYTTSPSVENTFTQSSETGESSTQYTIQESFTTQMFSDVTKLESNESSTENPVLETPTTSVFLLEDSNTNSFQNESLFQFSIQETTTYKPLLNDGRELANTENPINRFSNPDNAAQINPTLLKKIYDFGKLNYTLSIGNVSYRLNLGKLSNMLNDNFKTSLPKISKENKTSIIPVSHNNTGVEFNPITTKNPLFSNFDDDIINNERNEDNIISTHLPTTAQSDSVTSEWFSVTTESMFPSTIKSNDAIINYPEIIENNDNKKQQVQIDKHQPAEIGNNFEKYTVLQNETKDTSSLPMLELVIQNSNINDFISKINHVPVVIKVFNPQTQKYHSVLITPDENIKSANISSSDNAFVETTAEVSENKIIEKGIEEIRVTTPVSEVILPDLHKNFSSNTYLDTHESFEVELPVIVSKEDKSLLPSKTESNLISINHLKELLLKSVEKDETLPDASSSEDTMKLIDNIPHFQTQNSISSLMKNSPLSAIPHHISPDNISFSVSESVMLNPEFKSKDNKNNHYENLFDDDKNAFNKPADFVEQSEFDFPIPQSVNDPIKKVLSIMENYKSPTQSTASKEDIVPVVESLPMEPLPNTEAPNKEPQFHLIPLYFDEDGFETSEESRRIYQFQRPTGDSKLKNQQYGIHSQHIPKGNNFDIKITVNSNNNNGSPHAPRGTKANNHYSHKFGFDINKHQPQMYNHGTYHQYSSLGDFSHMTTQKPVNNRRQFSDDNDNIKVNTRYSEEKMNYENFPQYSSSDTLSTILHQEDEGQIYNENNWKADKTQIKNLNHGNSPQQILPSPSDILLKNNDHQNSYNNDDKKSKKRKIQKANDRSTSHFDESYMDLLQEAANNHYLMIDNGEAHKPLKQQLAYRGILQHPSTKASLNTPHEKSEIKDYHKSDEENEDMSTYHLNGTLYHRTLPQFIPGTPNEDLFLDAANNDEQIVDTNYGRDNSKHEHLGTSSNILETSKNNNLESESTVKHVKLIPYSEPHRGKQIAAHFDDSSASDSFILLDDADTIPSESNIQKNKNDNSKLDERLALVEESSNDDNSDLYPKFKADISRYGRRLN
ncbi:uncharacterized protein CDAR_295391 [Caerostris darwini]|uniref:Uncharacterized protein n=1 Tax=Caerostris darwini TaxID=1538125 RepID=A0AAV4QYF3_9ARAC|nr:uncharacterized protein CDAR_295391 [Caerostris darwini]